ncbi:MAG: hypothetical protein QM768_18395 [Agriterribacter sp.]
MKKVIYTLVIIAVSTLNADAKIWRVNNNAGVVADFNNIAAAVTAAAAGDTIYIEGSATAYGGSGLAKKLTFIGTGYFLSGANSNTDLQANPNPASVGYFGLDSAASGSVFIGLAGLSLNNANAAGFGADNITISRCILNGINIYWTPQAGTIADNWNINKCYVGNIAGNIGAAQNWNISNNIFTNYLDLSNTGNNNNVVRNNVFRNSVAMYSGYFANNIISYNISFINVVVKNNVGIGNPSGFSTYVGANGNISGYTDAQVFQGISGNSTDGQWRLATGSPAIAAGLTVGAVTTPDAGAFGGPDPYKLSGIANIPTIYSLTVPASIPSGTNSMTITFSSRNNN